MKLTILKPLMLYVIGFSVTAFIYFTTEHSAVQGLSLYDLTFALTMLTGVIWLIVAMVSYNLKSKAHMRDHILVHSLAAVSFVIYLCIQVTTLG